jgi:hypothetical protein
LNFILAFVVFREERWKVEELFRCAAGSALVALRTDWVDRRAGGRFQQKGVEIAKIFLELAQLARVDGGRCTLNEGELRAFLFELGFEDLPCAGDGVALAVEETLDTERHLDVTTAVEALSGATLVGLELRELALPETQDVGGNVAELRDFADAEVELVRYV